MKSAAFLIAFKGLWICVSSSYAFAPQNVPKSRHYQYDATFSLFATETAVEESVENPSLAGLALMLDDGTRKSHSMAESTQFVSGLFKGLADRDSYRSLITSLYFVYEAMEDSMENSSDESVKAMDYPSLRRLQPLKNDMKFFHGEQWEGQIQPSAAAEVYVARIREIAETKPYLIVAHQYTRYLGDLFGGKMIGGMTRRSLSLENGDGTAFYTFEGIPNVKDFITEWYSNLNALDLTEQQKEEIVDEANRVFALNIDLMQELTGSPLKAMLILTINSLKEKRMWLGRV